MHHSNHGNMHGGGGGGPHSGPPPGPGPMNGPVHRHQMHQPMPHHQPLPPHQMHHDNRHPPMGMSQPTSMGGVNQSMGGMGQPLGVPPPMHGPTRPHQIRPMQHHQASQHHNMPSIKPMRRPYHMGGYGGPLHPPSYTQHPPAAPQQYTPTQQPVEVSADCEVTAPAKTAEATTRPVVEAEGSGSEGGVEAAAAAPVAQPNPLANSKEKTPMCLVNELARFNKIKHQYRLTSETGPAHKKIFTVTLRLGDNEEYTAEGSSIKRAQHAAASAALASTKFSFPPAKLVSHTHSHAPALYRATGAVMPTVELNALAMKVCKPAVYTPIPPVPAPPPPHSARFPRYRPPYPPYPPRFHPPHPGSYMPPYERGVQRFGAPVYRVRVSVGEMTWEGEGNTPQAARHDAAARALVQLRQEMIDSEPAENNTNLANIVDSELDIKSPVSLVHELALKENLSVIFNVKSERGPPHMRVFVTSCTVGDLEVEGEGNGKKQSKKRAAELMVQEMRKRWPLAVLGQRTRPPNQQRLKRKPLASKSKCRNLIKENGDSGETASDTADNPISQLAMARHAARARSPQYSVLEERGSARRREFVVECEAPPHRAVGLGANKKLAKRRAAHNVLVAMGMAANSEDSAIKPTTNGTDITELTKTRTEGESAGGCVSGGQPVPGVLLMPDYHRTGQPSPTTNGISETAATGGVAGGAAGGAVCGAAGAGSPGAKDKLIYLSRLLGFSVQFSDFPKRNHGEFLSLVALSTAPPVMCHGGGASTQESHEACSLAALRALAKMGLDAVSHDTSQATPNCGGTAGLLSSGISD